MFARAAVLSLALALLQLVDAQSFSERASTKPAGCKPIGANTYKGLKNVATCISTVKTEEIDNPKTGVQVGTINNWAGGRIPPALRGVFYLEGDPFSAEVMSTGTAYWNSTTRTFDMAIFSPRTWTSDVGSGQPKHNLEEGTVFQSNCTTTSKGLLSCLTREYHFKGDKSASQWGDYTCDQLDASGEEYVRQSNLGIIPILGNPIYGSGSQKAPIRYTYHMHKIVGADGKRTARFQTNYLANKHNMLISYKTGQVFTHLGDYQEVLH